MYQSISDETVQPGSVPFQTPQKHYLVWSIINLLFCCMPLGLAALFFSIETRDANSQNNSALALKHSGTAYRLNIAATVIGTIVITVLIITTVLIEIVET